VGGTDPQDPISNLPDLKRNFSDSRAVTLPYIGHDFGLGARRRDPERLRRPRHHQRPAHNPMQYSQIALPTFQLSD
jgi:hypothetical protein